MIAITANSKALVILSGTFLWAVVAVLAGAHRAPFGVIELMALFAALVAVPLGLELISSLGYSGESPLRVARMLQPFAAGAIVVSIWFPPGRLAAVLCAPWFLFASCVALGGIAALVRKPNRSLQHLALALAGVDLALAAGWLVLSRAGLRPMGFQEPIVLLTAVHFYYSGFATAILAAVAIHRFEKYERQGLRSVVWLVILLPYALATGFVLGRTPRMIAALVFTLSVTALAGLLLWYSGGLAMRVARVYLRLGSGSALAALALAGVYAASDYAGHPFLTMSGMATTHGVLNGLGFVLLSMLAFLMDVDGGSVEWEEPAGESGASVESTPTVARKPPSPVPRPIPEFVARDFYDR